MSTNAAPVSLSERIEAVDALRGLAVGGILIGNMQWFSGYGMMPASLHVDWTSVDKVVHFLVHFIIEGKFYSIFSFLFGFGFALQIARAAERGDLNASVFMRRLFWLLVIGLLHAYLLWAGDILSIYALMGFLLLLFRNRPNQSLIKWAAVLMAVPIVTYILIYVLFAALVPPEALAGFEAGQAERWYGQGSTVRESSFFGIVSDFNLNYIVGRYAGLILQMRLPKILAMFLLGVYAYRRGVFHDPAADRPFVRKVIVYGLGLGLAGNALMAAASGSEAAFPPWILGLAGVVGYSFGVPALALGIAASVLVLWQRPEWRPALSFLGPVGRMALTNYLMQTVICVLVFYGYGLGYFGSVGPTTATILAFGIFAFQIVFSRVWLKYFAYGPVEWIWRQLTYRKRLSLRIHDRPTLA